MSFPPSHPALDRALAARGYETPTSVQSAVLEIETKGAEAGADLLVSAQTGSGKTVAFGLAMASTLLGEAERFSHGTKPVALIIAPTRELAMQISRELGWLYAETGARIVECVGGMDVRREQRQLANGAHIIVGTPGRLRDHLERNYLDLSELKVAVLDEADEMLDLGFREELEAILDATPQERRTLLFSATIARGIAQLAAQYQRDAVRIDTIAHDEPHGDIEYRAIRVAQHDIERAVVNVLRYFEAPRALVFCHTREAVRHLHASLRERGFSVVALSGELNQRERTDALQALRDGHARICVATDVAARGLDLPDLGMVIHADLPTNKAGLLHRSGRTGRAGRKGISVLMVTRTKRRRCEQILASANISATWQAPPTAEEIRAQDRLRLLDDPMFAETPSEEDLALARLLMEKLAPEQIAAALMRVRRAEHPEPEDVYDDNSQRDSKPPRERVADRSLDRERPAREPRTPREDLVKPDDGAWFRVNVGRRKNAEAKWLVPFICRVGNVTKADIGPIRIFDEETKFAIISDALPAFTEAVRVTLENDIRVVPSAPPRARSENAEFTPRPDRAPRGDRKFEDRKPKRFEADPAVAEAAPAADDNAGQVARPDRNRTQWQPAQDAVVSEAPARREFRPREDRPQKPRFEREGFKPDREHSSATPGNKKPHRKGQNRPYERPAESATSSERPQFAPRTDAGSERPARPFKSRGPGPEGDNRKPKEFVKPPRHKARPHHGKDAAGKPRGEAPRPGAKFDGKGKPGKKRWKS